MWRGEGRWERKVWEEGEEGMGRKERKVWGGGRSPPFAS